MTIHKIAEGAYFVPSYSEVTVVNFRLKRIWGLVQGEVRWPIRLPVPIVVMYDGNPSLNRLPVGLDAAKAAQEFYMKSCGVLLQTRVLAKPDPPWPSGPEYVNNVLLLFRFEFGSEPFLALVRSDVSRLSSGRYLGEAFGGAGGFCAVAGDQPLVAETLIHELGHLFGLEHEEGTFMRATLETENRVVTPAQKAAIRAVAYRYGGL